MAFRPPRASREAWAYCRSGAGDEALACPELLEWNGRRGLAPPIKAGRAALAWPSTEAKDET